MKTKTIRGEGSYYALFCDCGESEGKFLLCGVYASKEEAQKVAKEVEDCPARHFIRKVEVEVSFSP
jgi:phosphoheptose isomerase